MKKKLTKILEWNKNYDNTVFSKNCFKNIHNCKIPILFHHNETQCIGLSAISMDNEGIHLEGVEFDPAFKILEERYDKDTGVRIIEKANLLEISVIIKRGK